MATGRRLESESYVAAADLSTHQFKIMKVTAQDTVNIATAATDRGVGVLQGKPKSGETAEVMQLGISKIVSDGSGTAIAAGDQLTSDGSGRAIKTTTSGNYVVGLATEPSSAANIIIGVDLTKGGYII